MSQTNCTICASRPKLRGVVRCSRCQTLWNSLRKTVNHQRLAPSHDLVRSLLGQAPTPSLKGAGHKRSCNPRKQTKREREAWKVIREEKKKREKRGGSIYLIAEKANVKPGDPVKVGFSDDPEGRPAGLQTGNPRKLHLLGYIPGGEADERKLHARFIENNILGEWFRPSDELLSVFSLSFERN